MNCVIIWSADIATLAFRFYCLWHSAFRASAQFKRVSVFFFTLSFIISASADLSYLHHKVFKDFLNVHVCLGRNIIIFHFILLRQFSCFGFEYTSLIFHVAFVSYQNHGNIWVGVLMNTLKPCLYISKGLFISHIKRDNDALRLFVKR